MFFFPFLTVEIMSTLLLLLTLSESPVVTQRCDLLQLSGKNHLKTPQEQARLNGACVEIPETRRICQGCMLI